MPDGEDDDRNLLEKIIDDIKNGDWEALGQDVTGGMKTGSLAALNTAKSIDKTARDITGFTASPKAPFMSSTGTKPTPIQISEYGFKAGIKGTPEYYAAQRGKGWATLRKSGLTASQMAGGKKRKA